MRLSATGFGLIALLSAHTVLAAAIELPARVVADPRRTQHLAAVQPSLLQAPATGLPLPGAMVGPGEVLATLTPQLSEPDRRDLGVELAAARRDAAIGKLQLQRFGIEAARQFDVQLPTPTALLVADYRTADGKRTALDAGIRGQKALQAPQAAQVLRTRASADAAVPAGAVVFELLEAGALAAEALLADDDLDPTRIHEAITLDGTHLAVQLIAQSYDARLRSHRLLFALPADAPVAVQQPLRLVVSAAP